jgi:hypothetical protein
MRSVTLPLPLLGFVVVTRAALGAGLGLLLAERLRPDVRRRLGFALIGVGAATTIPAVRSIAERLQTGQARSTGRDARLIGMTRYPRKGDEPL